MEFGSRYVEQNFFIFICERNEKTSQYKGVSYYKYTGKWQAVLSPKGQRPKYGGRFNDELDAAKRVNQLCENFGIPQQNPGISTTPNEPYQVTKLRNIFCSMVCEKMTTVKIYLF